QRWDVQHPTIDGRRQIIQAYVGGGTQYLTAAQGMPPEILKRIEKLALDFFWEYKRSHTVDMATLKLPREEGGVNLLDIEVRNEAIYLTWLRDYCSSSSDRPAWAFVADEILKRTTTLELQDSTEGNTDILTNFLEQSWCPMPNPVERGGRPNLQATGLPLELKLMFSVAKKHSVRLDAPFVDEQAKLTRSLWFHSDRDAPTRRILKRHTRCLRENHKVRTVADAVRCASNPYTDATVDGHRESNCRNPNACQRTARGLVSSLNEKWTPDWNLPDLSLELSGDERAMNLLAEEYSNPVIFDPSFPRPEKPLAYARVFTNALKVRPSAPPPDRVVAGFHDELPLPNPEETVACCG
ncbi:hypothetical protein BKA62DRAFT_600338, partial [Auriculariales sp. MPI-PUGE-AT-0066]